MYDVRQKPTRSQAFARVICHIVGQETGLVDRNRLSRSGD